MAASKTQWFAAIMIPVLFVTGCSTMSASDRYVAFATRGQPPDLQLNDRAQCEQIATAHKGSDADAGIKLASVATDILGSRGGPCWTRSCKVPRAPRPHGVWGPRILEDRIAGSRRLFPYRSAATRGPSRARSRRRHAVARRRPRGRVDDERHVPAVAGGALVVDHERAGRPTTYSI